MWWWRTALGGATTKYTIVEGAPSTVAVDGSINRVPPPFKGCIDNAPPLLIGAFTAIILIVLTTGIWFTEHANEWGVLDTVFFFVTITTTIGYGTPAPTTICGRVLTMLLICVCTFLFARCLIIFCEKLFIERVRSIQQPTCAISTRGHLPNNVLLKVLAQLLAVVLVGWIGLYCFEDWTLFDAFYVVIITVSTVGLGDLVPLTDGGRLFAVVWMVVGVYILWHCLAQCTAAYIRTTGIIIKPASG